MFKKWIDKLSGQKQETPDDKAEQMEAPSETSSAAHGDEADVPVITGALKEYAAEKEEEKQKEAKEAPLPESTSDSDAAEPADKEEIKNRVVDMMRSIYDPEIPVNIYDIGLIYKIEPKENGNVELVMTLTTPNCPAAGILPGQVESKARSVDGVRDVEFELTFDPPWTPDMMSEGAKLELGMM